MKQAYLRITHYIHPSMLGFKLINTNSIVLIIGIVVAIYYISIDTPYSFHCIGVSISNILFGSNIYNSGRTNGNGIISDTETLQSSESEFKNFQDSTITMDTISEMKRYASSKTALYNTNFPDNIEELKVDGMSDFACSVCVNDTSFDEMVSVILGRLKSSIPTDVYDTLKDSLLVENMTYEGSFQNCTKSLQDTGRANNFLGWWTVRHNKHSNRYSACVVISGIDITMSEDIIDYSIKKETIHITNEPCHCGFFRCQSCPVFKTIETRIPIFKRHSITLKQHDNLKAYMMYKSTDLIKSLTYDEYNNIAPPTQ